MATECGGRAVSSTRRGFLQLAGGVALASALPSPAFAAGVKRPKKLVHFFLKGGMDAVMSTDPRVRKDADAIVNIPYAEHEIKTIGPHRVAPAFAALGAYLPRMAIVNGVACGTVAHETGEMAIHHMQRSYLQHGRALVGTIGDALRAEQGDGRSLADYRIVNAYRKWEAPAGRTLVAQAEYAGTPNALLTRIGNAMRDPQAAPLLRRVMTEQANACAKDACEPLVVVSQLLDRIAAKPPPDPDPNKEPFKFAISNYFWGAWLGISRDVVYVLESDLAPAVFIDPPLPFWDSHGDNTNLQSMSIEFLAAELDHLTTKLAAIKRPDGSSLADEVGFVISSELGRFPGLNAQGGKDHFPELPVLLMGPGIKPGQYGETSRTLNGQPISFQTGRPSSSKSDRQPTIDDVGATVLRWFGIDDIRSTGYLGTPMDFLLA
jgi:hypothetical protein